MASFSWSDTLQAFVSCVPCLHPSAPRDEDDNPHDPTRNRVRRARPDELESLLADADTTDTEAETLSLHSNPGGGRVRRKKMKSRKISLCGLDLFGKRRPPIQLPEDEEDTLLARRRSSATTSTFDSDAASLDASDLAQFDPAELERRAKEEDERRLKEERRRQRRERREMQRVAEAIAAGALDADEGVYVDAQPVPAARMSAPRRMSIDAFGPFQQAGALSQNPSPVPSGSPVPPLHAEDADDDDADLDGGLYAGLRRPYGDSSVSGSDSRSRTSTSQQDPREQVQPMPQPGDPAVKEKRRKKTKSGKGSCASGLSSKSSRSRASDTSGSTAQSPSLMSPNASSFAGAQPAVFSGAHPAVYAVEEHAAEDDFDGVVGMGLDSAPAQAYTSAELKPAQAKWGAQDLTVDVRGLTPDGGLPSSALATGMPSPGFNTALPSPGLMSGMPSPGLGGAPRRQSNARDLGAFLASK
ncbi:hypothetical protein BD626DRAFT_498692 [Schizophyllum amplum]|uniref:Uncharacterized protein n=1 Tax=Schizophyllum amplum TaxID=97359 RepID=A0A550CBS9_9AGAR|nr:hypothetical protein BD626DRAFT_498692 [Auriculariopsis ampla]